MKKLSHILSLSEVRKELPDLIDRVDRLHDRFIITSRGRARAVLISSDEFDGGQETLDILSNRAEMRALRRSEGQERKGQIRTYKEAFGKDY